MNRNCPKEYFIILYREFWEIKTAYRYQVIQVVTLSSPIIGGHDSPFKRSHLTTPKGWLVDYLLTALASCWASRVRRFGAPICKHQDCFAFMSDVRSGSCGAEKYPSGKGCSFLQGTFVFLVPEGLDVGMHWQRWAHSCTDGMSEDLESNNGRKSSKELLKQPSLHRRGRIWDPVAVAARRINQGNLHIVRRGLAADFADNSWHEDVLGPREVVRYGGRWAIWGGVLSRSSQSHCRKPGETQEKLR